MLSRGWTVAALFLAFSASAAFPEPPQQLIQDVVFNELADHQHHGYFKYLDVKSIGADTVVAVEVETGTGRVQRKIAANGQSLSASQQEEETRRLDALLHDAGQQQKLLRDYQGDEDRIARIVSLLPNGFLYEEDGVEGGNIRLKYRPNPAFKPPTYEARVFHAMQGRVWIDSREKRLVRLEGQLISNVDFGYGLLGRLDKGGAFNLERTEVVPGSWKTCKLDVHITGHVVLLKSIGKDQTEWRSEFRPVPADLTLEQAESLLSRTAGNDSILALMNRENAVDPRRKPASVPVGIVLSRR